jgi:hypothetical protein
MAKSELLDVTPIVTETALLLVTVIDFAALVVPSICFENARLRGVNVIEGAIPVPTKWTVGERTAPAAKVTVSMRLPRAVGVKVIATVQDCPDARVVPAAPHIFPATMANSPGTPETIGALVNVTVPVVAFVSMKVFCALVAAVVANWTDPKISDPILETIESRLMSARNELTNPEPLPRVVWYGDGVPLVGKSVENVEPAVYELPAASLAIALPAS